MKKIFILVVTICILIGCKPQDGTSYLVVTWDDDDDIGIIFVGAKDISNIPTVKRGLEYQKKVTDTDGLGYTYNSIYYNTDLHKNEIKDTAYEIEPGTQLIVGQVISWGITPDETYKNYDPGYISLVNEDDDSSDSNITPDSSSKNTTNFTFTGPSSFRTTEDGGNITFLIALASEPSNDVRIYFTSSNTNEGTVSPDYADFNSNNWSSSQTITVTGVDDDDNDGDIKYKINMTIEQSNIDNADEMSRYFTVDKNNEKNEYEDGKDIYYIINLTDGSFVKEEK